MGKKRKSSSGPKQPSGPNLDVGSSRKRIRDFEDVAGSDDEFHLGKDKVLLEEAPDAKRRRKVKEDEEFLSDDGEDVLGYEDESEDEDRDGGAALVKGGKGATSKELQDEEESDGSDGEREDEEEGVGWGMSKDDLYGADAIETEEQALEEEAEALRLQKKQLQAMNEADYGFDETEWQDGGEEKDAADAGVAETITEVLPQLRVAADMGPAERLKLLKTRYPEFEPLSKELLRLEEVHEELAKDTKTAGARPIATLKLRAVAAYIGALTMYFTLLTSPAADGQADVVAMSASQLRDHPVMDSLVHCRELWQQVADLPPDVEAVDATPKSALVPSASSNVELPAQKHKEQKRPQKSRAQRHADAAQAAADARKSERLQKTESDLAGLDNLLAPSARRKSSKKDKAPTNDADVDSDIGEEAPLSKREAAEKAQHKRSLRFYTSQIAQKANKRGAAGRNAGGDDDIPHRERLRDRQARLNAEAEKRGRRDDADADLGGESDDEDARQAAEIREGAADDEYYDMVASRTSKKKADKAALAAAQKEAALQGGQVIEEESVGADGKRKINYLIEKNKGLTPHRKKDVRNPRVKKRKKFDEKKKKLGSMRAVYKGGEGRGGYGGELTGIKSGVVKSTKL